MTSARIAGGRSTAAATASPKPHLDIEPAQLLVVQRDALAPQQDMQPALAEAPSDSGNLALSGPDETIVRPPAAIADRAAIHPDRLACPPLLTPWTRPR
jgi:hypothetical protein